MKTDIIENEKKINLHVLFAYFLSLALFVVLRICGSCGLFSFLGIYGSYFLSLFTQLGIILFVPLIIFTLSTRSKVRDVLKFCSFKKISWKVLLISFALGLVIFLLNNYVSSFFNSIIQAFGYKPSSGGGAELPATWWTLILDLICTAVLPAFAEEVLHRGLLLNGVSMMGMKKSILISGALFGLFHLNIEQCFYAIIIGFFLGYLCYISCSIYPCIIVHFMNNATSVFLSFARDKGWAIGNVLSYFVKSISQNTFLGLVIYVLIFVLLVMIVLKMIKFIMKETFQYTFVKNQKEITNQLIRQNFYQEIDNIKNNNMIVQQQRVFNIDFKDIFEFIQKNKDEIQQDDKEFFDNFKLDFRAKILLWGSFALSIILTVMTFIWGLLR